MPNWCVGTLKIRGDYEAIKRFAAHGIQKTELEYEGKEFEETIYHVYGIGYVKGTQRGLVQSDYINIFGCDEQPGKGICAFDYQQAWSVRADEWQKISQTYGFDVKIMAIESGMQFIQDILIVNGAIQKDTYTEYTDMEHWLWECPFPLLGG
nr:MAG TPA: hypothetical protein [Caudoviricetes sp.]